MRVSYANNALTVVTNITHEVATKGYADLKVLDDKKNEVLYVVAVSNTEVGSLSRFGMSANAVIDGKLAVVLPQKIDTSKDDVMKKYGEALLAADKYTTVISATATDKEAAISALFDAE